jgi:NDP-hexose C3-ketoreductase / dTDP-4-oxo-2-deoxy-alpha-D-pentos-2-ene 2,3-reductase
MNFGPQGSEPESFALMDQALVHGINLFDTASVYGAKAGKGVTEEIIGRRLASGNGRREKIVPASLEEIRPGPRGRAPEAYAW